MLKPPRYEGSHQAEAFLVLLLIGFLMLSDMVFEGAALPWIVDGARASGEQGGHVFDVRVVHGMLISVRLWSYWLHIVSLFGFLNLLPLSKHFHVLTALPNLFFRKLSRGEAKPPVGMCQRSKSSKRSE